jgi:uncharacterized membrane protein YtjA (UPF0391 family)
VASPDTDELATVPVPSPAGAPDAETAPQERVAPNSAPAASAVTDQLSAAEAETAPQERVEPERVQPDPAAADEASLEPAAAASPARERGRWWRGLTGSLAAGLAVLAVGVLAVAGIDLYTGAPGPGAAMLIGHPVAAVLALLAQRVADRRNGIAAAGAGIAVVLFVVSALTLFWLT